MKERPILFSAPMVLAILAGTKTQTRRVLPTMTTLGRVEYPGKRDRAGKSRVNWLDTKQGINAAVRECRYGQPGDRLWVRETWMDLQGTGVQRQTGDLSRYAYGADTQPGSHGDECRKDYGLKWRPSIHMPRAASRISLQITGLRVERLQEISEADAVAEGVAAKHTADANYTAREAYAVLWEQINGGGSWDVNPWVWVIEFGKAA